MYLLELLRFLREKATTPARVIGLLGLYLAYAVYEGSPVYEPFLAGHKELLLPLSGIGLCYWALKELFDYMINGQLIPATQKELARIEELTETIESRQRRLADTIGEAYWETDMTGKMIFSNYANAQLYGTTARELVRSGTAPYIHKDDLQDAYRHFHQAIQGKMGFSIEFDVVNRGELVHSLRVYAWPLFDENEKFIGHFGSAEIVEGY